MNPNKDDIFISTCFSNILVDISAEVGGVIYLCHFFAIFENGLVAANYMYFYEFNSKNR